MRKREVPYFISSSVGFVYRFGREFGVSWETWSVGHKITVLGEFISEEEDGSPRLVELPELASDEICHSIIQREIELVGKSYHNYNKRGGKRMTLPKFEIFEKIYKPCARELRDELARPEEQN